jgi:hypothetical protein
MNQADDARRRAVIRAVLARAEASPTAGLPYESLPEAAETFRDRRELLLALQYEWSRALWARIELLSQDGTPAAEVASTAWSYCAARQPVLRRLLDTYRHELGLTCTVG